MSGGLLLEMRVETTVYTSFQETTSRLSLMPGLASSNFLTKLVPSMPVPVNQSLVLGPYWQMITSRVMSSASAKLEAESNSRSVRNNATAFFITVVLLILFVEDTIPHKFVHIIH